MADDPALITGRLNVDDYVEVRKDDINKLESLLDSSGSGAKKRAFQSLPRIERRRAASHNPKRVPRNKGLRKLAELEAIRNNSLKKNKHVRKPLEIKRTSEVKDLVSINSLANYSKNGVRYGNRQKNKVWLPTHVWHKKRAFLQNVAGIEVPLTATQKQFRRTYRLTSHVNEHGAMAWDTSYYSTLIIIGRSDKIVELVEDMFPGSSKEIYKCGDKSWQGLVQNADKTEKQGPALVYWFAKNSLAVQCHPLLFDTVWSRLIKNTDILELQDCRYSIGSIDIIGTHAIEILKKALVVRDTEPSAKWSEIVSGNLPYNAALHLSVSDPRCNRKDELQRVSSVSIFSQSDRLSSLKNGVPSNSDTVSLNTTIPSSVFVLEDGRLRVLLPRDWVLPFWLFIFTRRNSVLIGGTKELHQLAFERKTAYFPSDFICSDVGFEFAKQNSFEESSHLHMHLPKRKRPKTSPVTVIAKFIENSKPSGFDHVVIRPFSRGVPKEGARIHLVKDFNHDSHGHIADISELNETNLAGYITTGNFSYSSSQGIGIGFIKRNMVSGSQQSCVIVNPNSHIGILFHLEFLNSDHNVCI